jgi:hypothetical protein
MDHRIPLSRGGGADLDNLALCCGGCNRAKGPLIDREFIELLAFLAHWPDRGYSLLCRLRGGFWTYRGDPNALYNTPRGAIDAEIRANTLLAVRSCTAATTAVN